jgi:hypothetical protein
MAIDYTSLANVKAYGPIDGNTDDTIIGSAITGYSRLVDEYCRMQFSQATYTEQQYRAEVSADGLLKVWTDTPTIANLTAAAYKSRRQATWTPLSLGDAETENRPFGSFAFFRGNYSGYRGESLRVRLTYTGGWANLAAVPSSFEFLMRRLVWWIYRKRDAPDEKTAIPEMGVLIIPSQWPPDVRKGLATYTRQIAIL